jgi:carbon monoxide dehydrogenase subunit G
MIHFEGERTFPLPLAEVVKALGDAGFLVASLPDIEVVETGADKAIWKMRPGFSFIRTTLENTLTVLHRDGELRNHIKIYSSGIGASSTVEVKMSFHAQENGTLVKWTGDITSLTGLLKMVPKGLIQSSAGKVIEETWTAVSKRLS